MQLYEKDFEDWICENIQVFLGTDRARLVGRQVPLPSGRIMDVLALRPGAGGELVVVELKRDQVDISAVVQVLTYMGELADLLEGPLGLAVYGVLSAPTLDPDAERLIRAVENLDFIRVGASIYSTQHEVRGALRTPFDDPSDINELLILITSAATQTE